MDHKDITIFLRILCPVHTVLRVFQEQNIFSRQHFYVSITNLNFYVVIIAAMSLAGSANA